MYLLILSYVVVQCTIVCTIVPTQVARLKKGTAQSLSLANSTRIFFNLSFQLEFST